MRLFYCLLILGTVGGWRLPAQADEAPSADTIKVSAATDEVAMERDSTRCVLENGDVFISIGASRNRLPLPGPALGIFEYKNQLYAALGKFGAVVFDISDPKNPVRTRHIGANGDEIIGFALVDGDVWMRSVSTKIVPFGEDIFGGLASSIDKADVAPPPLTSAPKRTPERRVRVIAAAAGKVTLNVGARDGVAVGDRFSVFRSVSVTGGGAERFEGRELAAVVEVAAVNEDRCLAVLWRGDRVTMEDSIAPRAPEHRTSLVFPRHLTDLAEISVALRPTMNVVGPLGFGAINDLSATYWGEGYFAGIRLTPLGFAFSDTGNALVMNLTGEGGYDARAFAIGLGVGLNAVTFKKNAFSISQSVRLGARDGLNLTTRNAFSLRKYTQWDGNEEVMGFEWGGLSSRMTIPLTGRTALFFEGGGSPEYFFADVGVDAWVIGNGDAGSLGISVAAGAAGIFVDNYHENENFELQQTASIETVGPMMSLGINYRFGLKK